MAHNITSQADRLLKTVGSYCELACGIAPIGTTFPFTVTVTVPSLARVDGVVCSPQSNDAVVYPNATSGNTFTLLSASVLVENLMWFAWGIPRA